MKLHTWVIRNDEKNYVYLRRAKSLWTLRRNINENKETIIGRRDKLKDEREGRRQYGYQVCEELNKGSFVPRYEIIGFNGQLEYTYY